MRVPFVAALLFRERREGDAQDGGGSPSSIVREEAISAGITCCSLHLAAQPPGYADRALLPGARHGMVLWLCRRRSWRSLPLAIGDFGYVEPLPSSPASSPPERTRALSFSRRQRAEQPFVEFSSHHDDTRASAADEVKASIEPVPTW